MLFELKSIVLKNGATCILRSPRAQDASAMLRLIRQTSGETDNLLRYPDEVQLTPAQERAMIAATNASDDAGFLLALVGGELVASSGRLTPFAHG